MSRMILIVDLPDEVYCHGCKCLDESAEHCNASGKDLFDSVVYQFNNTIFPRPADCPLIPVDRVIERMGEVKDYLRYEVARAREECISILRDELGVTE